LAKFLVDFELFLHFARCKVTLVIKEIFYNCKFRHCGGCTFGKPDDLPKPTGASGEFMNKVHLRWCLQPPRNNPDLVVCDKKDLEEVIAERFFPPQAGKN